MPEGTCFPWDTGGMYDVDLYARVRRAVLVEGKSRRAVAREFGLARKTIRKMLEYSLPPGYRRQAPIRRPRIRSKDMLCVREMPLPADPEANRDLCRDGNEEVVKTKVKFR